MDGVVVAEMVKNPERENTVLGTALVMRLAASILCFFGIWGIVLVLEPGNKLLQTVTMLQGIALIFQTSEVLNFWFNAHLEMKYVTLAEILALTLANIWRISLLANSASVQWFALSSSILAFACGICVIIFFVKKNGFHLRVNFNEGRRIFGKSYHFIINGLAVTLYTQIDRIMLGKMVSEEAIGFYAAASTIAVMWEFVPPAITNSANPLLQELYGKNKEKFEEKYQILLLGITFLGIVVSFGFTVLGKLAVYILYGREYFAAVPALAVLIWSTAFAMIGTARAIWVIATGKNKYVKYYTSIGAVMNAVLNAFIIPRWGITGAACTTLFTQMFIVIFAPLLFRETRDFFRIYMGCFKRVSEAVVLLKNTLKNK
jgi:O-antigen/teichoic acid export membrane protein